MDSSKTQVQYTPGPWFITDEARTVWSVMARGSNVSGVVAHVNTDWPGQAQKEEQRANARLIVAAPELLEALQMFVWPHQEGDRHSEIERQEIGRAAIAKATGAQA